MTINTRVYKMVNDRIYPRMNNTKVYQSITKAYPMISNTPIYQLNIKENDGIRVKSFLNYLTGKTIWKRNGRLHRGDDKPAVISNSGKQEWWINGKRHRDNDKPAIVHEFNYGGEYHIYKEWWFNGKCHRDNDKPAIVKYKKDYFPSAIWIYEWWFNGQRHRGNYKPAVILCEGDDPIKYPCACRKWYIFGEKIQEKYYDGYGNEKNKRFKEVPLF